jgi:undecaprenyl-diphosphatase
MSYFDAVILGIVQGLTEFLPISSSGHLVLSEHLLHAKMPGVVFELTLHVGTLLAVLVYFRRRVVQLILAIFNQSKTESRSTIWYLIIGTIPAVIVGVLLNNIIEEAFVSPTLTSVMLVVTGLFLLATSLVRPGEKEIKSPNALLIGVAQALAIFPGISRSGSTISMGLFAGVKPMVAAEFSFLLSIPVIIGAVVFKSRDIIAVDTGLLGHYIVGAVMSFVFGLLAVHFLLNMIKKGRFKYFGIYCLLVGMFGIVYFTLA